MHYTRLTAFIVVTLAATGTSVGKSPWWPQFRGVNASGVAEEQPPLPVEFGARENVVWSIPVNSGVSSPCIWDDRIFLTAYDRESTTLETLCINRATGQTLWSHPVPAESIEEVHMISSPAASTPATDGERVYFYFGSYGLLCYDVSGKLVWTRPMPNPENTYGVASSPIVAGDLLIVNHQGNDAQLLGIDRLTGEAVWTTDRSSLKYGWSTPVHCQQGRVEEIVVLGGDFGPGQRLMAYGLSDGTERWWIAGLPPCGKSTPTVKDGIIYFAAPDIILETEFVQSNPQQAEEFYAQNAASVTAVRLGGQGSVGKTHVVWSERRGVPGVPSPLVYRDRVYFFKNGGIVFCRNAEDGTLVFAGRTGVGGEYYSSPVAADGKIYIASSRGVVSVLQAGDQLNVLARNDLAEPIMATPAIVDGTLYIRTERHLYAFARTP